MPSSFKPSLPKPTFGQLIPFLLLPAEIGLLAQIANATSIAQTVLALALAIFCPELTRMAWLDLKNVAAAENSAKELASEIANSPEEVRQEQVEPLLESEPKTRLESKLKGQPEGQIANQIEVQTVGQTDKRLARFRRVVTSTIVLEATGFYLAGYSLPVGAIIIIFSQFWFNLLAGIQIYPTAQTPVVPFPASRRKAVLVANAIALLLLCLWPIALIQQTIAIGLFTLISIFLSVKYGFSRLAQKSIN